jgi:hypothetical protein
VLEAFSSGQVLTGSDSPVVPILGVLVALAVGAAVGWVGHTKLGPQPDAGRAAAAASDEEKAGLVGE